MNVSVAMCTYNGGEYLPAQLDSILNQTYPPDQLIICDDGSNDGTRAILADYARLFPDTVHVHENETNLGVVKNFEKAIQLTTGDVIALSDQDDVWELDKLERQLVALKVHGADLVFHNAAVVSASLERRTDFWGTLTPPYSHGHLRDPRCGLIELVHRNVVQGASMMFRASLKNFITPIPRFWFYDRYIAVMAVLLGTVYDLNMELLRYRQHESQHLGTETESIGEKLRIDPEHRYLRYTRTVTAFEEGIDRIRGLDPECMTVDKSWAIDLFRRQIRFSSNRAAVYDHEEPLHSKLNAIANNVRKGRYSMGGGWAGALKDTVATLYLSSIGSYPGKDRNDDRASRKD